MIIFENGTQLENYGSIIGATREIRGKQRDSLEIMIRGTDYETLAELFVDGARFSVQTPDENVYDKYEYNIAGDIVDKRDGTFVVYMGVWTETEENVYFELIQHDGGVYHSPSISFKTTVNGVDVPTP